MPQSLDDSIAELDAVAAASDALLAEKYAAAVAAIQAHRPVLPLPCRLPPRASRAAHTAPALAASPDSYATAPSSPPRAADVPAPALERGTRARATRATARKAVAEPRLNRRAQRAARAARSRGGVAQEEVEGGGDENDPGVDGGAAGAKRTARKTRRAGKPVHLSKPPVSNAAAEAEALVAAAWEVAVQGDAVLMEIAEPQAKADDYVLTDLENQSICEKTPPRRRPPRRARGNAINYNEKVLADTAVKEKREPAVETNIAASAMPLRKTRAVRTANAASAVPSRRTRGAAAVSYNEGVLANTAAKAKREPAAAAAVTASAAPRRKLRTRAAAIQQAHAYLENKEEELKLAATALQPPAPIAGPPSSPAGAALAAQGDVDDDGSDGAERAGMDDGDRVGNADVNLYTEKDVPSNQERVAEFACDREGNDSPVFQRGPKSGTRSSLRKSDMPGSLSTRRHLRRMDADEDGSQPLKSSEDSETAVPAPLAQHDGDDDSSDEADRTGTNSGDGGGTVSVNLDIERGRDAGFASDCEGNNSPVIRRGPASRKRSPFRKSDGSGTLTTRRRLRRMDAVRDGPLPGDVVKGSRTGDVAASKAASADHTLAHAVVSSSAPDESPHIPTVGETPAGASEPETSGRQKRSRKARSAKPEPSIAKKAKVRTKAKSKVRKAKKVTTPPAALLSPIAAPVDVIIIDDSDGELLELGDGPVSEAALGVPAGPQSKESDSEVLVDGPSESVEKSEAPQGNHPAKEVELEASVDDNADSPESPFGKAATLAVEAAGDRAVEPSLLSPPKGKPLARDEFAVPGRKSGGIARVPDAAPRNRMHSSSGKGSDVLASAHQPKPEGDNLESGSKSPDIEKFAIPPPPVKRAEPVLSQGVSVEAEEFAVPPPRPIHGTNAAQQDSAEEIAKVPEISSETPAQTPTRKTKPIDSSRKLATRQPLTFNNRFEVNGKGKVSSSGLGRLDEICFTPLAKADAEGPSRLPQSGVRSGRLFAAPGDIYSSTRKPSHARIAPVTSSALKAASSGAVLSKTTGKRAPLRTLSTRSRDNPPSSNSGIDVQVLAVGVQPTASIYKNLVNECVEQTKSGLDHSSAHVEEPKLCKSSSPKAMNKSTVVAATSDALPGPVLTIEESKNLRSSLSVQGEKKAADLILVDSSSVHSVEVPPSAVDIVREQPDSAEEQLFSNVEAGTVVRKRSLGEDIYRTAPSKTMKRARIAFAADTAGPASERTTDLTERRPLNATPLIAKTAPLGYLRHPRVEKSGKSALRARIEGRRIAKPSHSAIEQRISSATVSTPRLVGMSSRGSLGKVRTSGSTIPSSGPTSGAALTGESVLSEARARVATLPIAASRENLPVTDKHSEHPERNSEEFDRPLAGRAQVPAPSNSSLANFQPGSSAAGSAHDSNAPLSDSDQPTSQLGNILTSISTFLPSFRARKEPVDEETAEQKAAAAKAIAERNDRRRAAEILRRKEAVRAARQREFQEKKRRAENRRELMAKAELHREEERRRKEADRARKLKEAEETRKKQREEEERQKEHKRRRVAEQQKRLAQQEAERRRALDAKARLQRQRLDRAAGNASNGNAIFPKAAAVAAAPAPPPPESYEMSATKHANPEESSDSETDNARRRKRVPAWARSVNLPHSLQGEMRDPDSIFPKVNTIDLEKVFQGHPTKRRFRARTSSGLWVRDRLTAKEELDYKKVTTGFGSPTPKPPPPPPPGSGAGGSAGAGASGL